MERRTYQHPPLEEAVCELQFIPGPEWEYTFQFLFFAKFQHHYPGKVQRRQMVEAGFQVQEGHPEAKLTMKGTASRVQYATVDGSRLVAIGENVLSIHALRPYSGWEELEQRIERAVQVYQEVARPAAVKRTSVRYINRVQIPVAEIELRDYFTTPPQVPPRLGLTVTHVLVRTESVFADIPVKLTSTFASVEAPPGSSGFLLDNDVTREWADPGLPLDQALTEIAAIKRRQTLVFESLITEKTREVFNVSRD